jgi:hypothetical protein
MGFLWEKNKCLPKFEKIWTVVLFSPGLGFRVYESFMKELSKNRCFSIGFWTIGQGFMYMDPGGPVLCFGKEGIAQHQLRTTEINKN